MSLLASSDCFVPTTRLDERQATRCKGRWRRRVAAAVPWCVWLYVAGVAAVWLLLFAGGDRWWFATLMLFAPRWAYAVPLALLGPLAALTRRRMVGPVLVAALIVLGPIMGFCLPRARLLAPDRPTLRVLTCNVKGHCKCNQALNELIRTASADIVALQGCWRTVSADWPVGWHVWQRGELLVASHYALRERAYHGNSPQFRVNMLLCEVATPEGDLSFCTMHPQSPHRSIDHVLSRSTLLRPSQSAYLAAEIEKRWGDSEAARQWLAECGGSEIIAGDLNLLPDSAIYRACWAQYHNAFGEAGLGFGYTEWPRMRKLRFGMRIDHVLCGADWRPRCCRVGPDIGSDHRPLIADLYRAD
jgi:endonuclease/exonuclease/phosphatase (EEP) superfamily protein YafD